MTDRQENFAFIGFMIAYDVVIGLVAAYLGAERPLMVVAVFNVLGAIFTLATGLPRFGRRS